MVELTFVQKIGYRLRGDYIDLEIRGDDFNRKDVREYTDRVIDHLQSVHPEFSLMSKKYTRYLEINRHLILAVHGIKFPGYLVRIAATVDAEDIKRTCRGLEIDEMGNRISDIDIYFPDNSKVSGKYGQHETRIS